MQPRRLDGRAYACRPSLVVLSLATLAFLASPAACIRSGPHRYRRRPERPSPAPRPRARRRGRGSQASEPGQPADVFTDDAGRFTLRASGACQVEASLAGFRTITVACSDVPTADRTAARPDRGNRARHRHAYRRACEPDRPEHDHDHRRGHRTPPGAARRRSAAHDARRHRHADGRTRRCHEPVRARRREQLQRGPHRRHPVERARRHVQLQQPDQREPRTHRGGARRELRVVRVGRHVERRPAVHAPRRRAIGNRADCHRADRRRQLLDTACDTWPRPVSRAGWITRWLRRASRPTTACRTARSTTTRCRRMSERRSARTPRSAASSGPNSGRPAHPVRPPTVGPISMRSTSITTLWAA